MKSFVVVGLFLFVSSCSGVSMITPDRKVADNIDTSKLYRQDFLQKINAAKEKVRQGKSDLALKDLAAMKEANLSAPEKATRKNLIGVINFSGRKFDVASKNFEEALLSSKEDPALEAQIYLNLGSAYYKMNQNEKALATLSQANYKNLQDGEAKKFHQLHALLSQQLGKKEQSLSSLIRSLEDKKTITELTTEARYTQAEDLFMKLSPSERVRLLEEFDQEKNIAVPYLAYKEAERSFREGDQGRVKDYTDWIEKRYGDNTEVMTLVRSLGVRNQNNSTKIDVRYIGVALPLSGDLKGLGERALAGIDIALEDMSQDPEKKYRLEIKDTKGNPANGAFAVKDLIEVNNVAAIIGGLNSSEATKEYLEAKKYGVVFISLSKVLLPKEEKNHLLIEIPGSIESQVSLLFSDKMLGKIGKRPAILYPRNDIGEAYANEFWRQSKKNNLDITGLISFDTNQTDYRDPIKNILGIKFNREREEELSIVNDIAHLESKKSIKRLQNLQPQVDFDWVFVPALPRETVQLLPNFNYFDAFNLSYVGVPSWRSELMVNEGYRYGNVFFMDESMGTAETAFTQKFFAKFKKQPNFVETIAYDSLKILSEVVEGDSSYETRQDLDVALSKKGNLQSETGAWKLQDDIWIKDMATFKIKREGIEQVLN
ncbi:ABC transporter substrate-binding protein [Bacteriovorax sp. PP10]|uniref:ABC transporter substrate-binding protein n=1 Tax=Bacteriovorax antarcticus TaxID=3088717 RepID=A0ABU5VPM6_9BACT|nr:ABC transporter substrate-binding protein [Bacteriovorax sp. PP10]MEA9354997.1 ABC transporter substrate-binding protein [Bacteriovorax sp. PP10]